MSIFSYIYFWRQDVSGPVQEHDMETEPQNRMDALQHHHFGALGHGARGMTEDSADDRAQPQQVRRADSPAAVLFGSDGVMMQALDPRVESSIGYGAAVHPGMVTMLSPQGEVVQAMAPQPYQPVLFGPPMVAQVDSVASSRPCLGSSLRPDKCVLWADACDDTAAGVGCAANPRHTSVAARAHAGRNRSIR